MKHSHVLCANCGHKQHWHTDYVSAAPDKTCIAVPGCGCKSFRASTGG